MNFINFGNTETFWSLFDKVFNRENITGTRFWRNPAGETDAAITSIGEDDDEESIESTLEIGFDEEKSSYVVFLIVGGVKYGVEYYIPSKVLSEKLGNDLWRTVRKQLRSRR